MWLSSVRHQRLYGAMWTHSPLRIHKIHQCERTWEGVSDGAKFRRGNTSKANCEEAFRRYELSVRSCLPLWEEKDQKSKVLDSGVGSGESRRCLQSPVCKDHSVLFQSPGALHQAIGCACYFWLELSKRTSCPPWYLRNVPGFHRSVQDHG